LNIYNFKYKCLTTRSSEENQRSMANSTITKDSFSCKVLLPYRCPLCFVITRWMGQIRHFVVVQKDISLNHKGSSFMILFPLIIPNAQYHLGLRHIKFNWTLILKPKHSVHRHVKFVLLISKTHWFYLHISRVLTLFIINFKVCQKPHLNVM
jgi:hypothetical protein